MGLPNMTQKQKPVTELDPNSNPVERESEKYEIKAGKLMLLHRMGQRTTRLPVYVRVYRNAFEHFAVVSKDQVVSTNSTYVNLRTSYCVASTDSLTQFEVVQNNFEGTVIRFDTGDKDSVADWVEAFQCASPPGSPTAQGGMSPTLSPAIPRSPVMPTLPEIDEEE
nr:hypothetical protein BaRGS_015979 [Batillaria attramentaria]